MRRVINHRARRGILGCRKISYPDRRVAEAVLALADEEHPWRRVYFCWQCRAWHLTSQQLTDPPAASA